MKLIIHSDTSEKDIKMKCFNQNRLQELHFLIILVFPELIQFLNLSTQFIELLHILPCIELVVLSLILEGKRWLPTLPFWIKVIAY